MDKLCQSGDLQPLQEHLSRLDDATLRAELNNRMSPQGYTLLHVAALNGHVPLLKLLISGGSEINARSNDGSTPLHLAVSRGHLQCVRFLVRQGSDLTVVDNRGRTAIETITDLRAKNSITLAIRSEEIISAASGVSTDLEGLLRSADPSQVEQDCLSRALLAAVNADNAANVSVLVEKGAQNLDEALQAAKSGGKHRSRALLLLVKAAMSNDVDLVLNLFGPPVSTAESFHEVQMALCGNEIPIDVPLNIAGRYGNTAVKEELLFRSKEATCKGAVLWNALQLVTVDVEWLQKKSCVLRLCLDHNNIKAIPETIGPTLQQLTKLELQFNHLEVIPACLLELPCLHELNLSHNNLMDLPSLPYWSPSLSILDISYNSLKHITGEPDACALEVLNLSHNKLGAVPQCVHSFFNLCTLDLSYNLITVLPEEIRQLRKLTTLNLDGLSVVKSAVKERKAFAKGYEEVSNSHLKVVVLGDEGVGKSTLISLLCGTDYHQESNTLGIKIHKWTASLDKHQVVFNLWDFSHLGSHHDLCQCFLTEESMYLLLFNAQHSWETVADGLVPWLEVLADRGENSRVLLVGTYQDVPSGNCHETMDLTLKEVTRLAEHYQSRLSAVPPILFDLQNRYKALALLKETICNNASTYFGAVLGQKVPSWYHKVRERAEEMYFKASRDVDFDPVMEESEYRRSLIEGIGIRDAVIHEELEELTAFLTRIGPPLYFRVSRTNKMHVVLDPGWLCHALFALFDDPSVFEGGLRTKQVRLNVPHAQKHIPELLSFLDQHSIVVTLSTDLHLVTSLLPPYRPVGMCVDSIDGRSPYTRYILLGTMPTTSFWTRLLSALVNVFPQVRSTAELQWGSCPIPASGYEPHDNIPEVCFWSTGVHYQDMEVEFILESLSHSEQLTHERKEGVVIVVSATDQGKRLIGQLTDMITTLIAELYPSNSGCNTIFSVEETMPCSTCIRMRRPLPFEFHLEHCLSALAQEHQLLECDCVSSTYGGCHKTALADLAPDVAFVDLDHQYHLKASSISIKENITVPMGKFGLVSLGAYEDLSVMIRKYVHSNCTYSFRCLRQEVLLLQTLNHPCIIKMIGICPQIFMGLVLEHAPYGSLDTVLSQYKLHRVTLHRLASEICAGLVHLHKHKIVLFNLKASSIQVWSLNPEQLCHCKISCLDAARHIGSPISYDLAMRNKTFAPEALQRNGWSRCDQKVDMFSFGMLLYHMVTGQEPFLNFDFRKISAAICRGRRPILQTSHPQPFPYLIQLLQQCWEQYPSMRPTADEAMQRLCIPFTQMVMNITDVQGSSLLLQSSCVVTQSDFAFCKLPSQDNEVWFCFDQEEGTNVKCYSVHRTMVTKMNFVVENQVQTMSVCGDHVWVSSRAGVDCGQLDLFHIGSKEKVYTISTGQAIVSCIVNSTSFVYCGTLEGKCLIFSMNLCDLGAPQQSILSDHAVEGMVLSNDSLWVSIASSIVILDMHSLQSIRDTIQSKQGFVGQLKLSSDNEKVWSYRIGATHISCWDLVHKVHVFDLNVQEHLKVISSCAENDMVLTAMTFAADTMWIGMATGHILVFHNAELLHWFHPYSSHIKFLLTFDNYMNSWNNNETTEVSSKEKVTCVISASSGFQLPNPHRKENKAEVPNGTETLIIWAAFSSSICRQLHLLNKRSATFCEDHHFISEMLQKGLFAQNSCGAMVSKDDQAHSNPPLLGLADDPEELGDSTSLLLSYSYPGPPTSHS